MLSQMRENYWKFTPINSIEESNFNKSLERFYKMGIHGLTRENIQNSLDAKIGDDPVIVKIELGKMPKKIIPGIDHIEDRINSLQGFNHYTRETISHMKNKIEQNEVYYISFEDLNTRGLTGAEKGQTFSQEDTWGIYAYNKGIHYEDIDNDWEVIRGGSHGIGKIASNAASDIHMMFFSNCDAEGRQHLGGTIQLIEHRLEDQAYRSTGYFTDVEINDEKNFTFYPYKNNFHNVFKKDQRGLKIVIPFLRKDYANEREIIRGVCDSFFVAILERKLVVHVNEHKITKDSIINYIKSNEYYEQEISEIKRIFTPLYLDTYLNEKPTKLTVNNIERDYHFDIYFSYNEQITTGRVAIIRTIGMKIEDFKVQNNVRKPFNAVLIGGLEEDKYLKTLENESHTRLEKDHINNPRHKRNATRFLRDLSTQVALIIDKAIREHNPIDGKMDTSNILYVMQTQFKKQLQESMSTVKIGKDRILVKSSGNERAIEKRQSRFETSKTILKSNNKRSRTPVKWQKGESEANRQGKKVFQALPESVHRVILGNRELVHIDLSNSEELLDVKTCSMGLSVIDGEGKEYKSEINLEESYKEIRDLIKGENCSFHDNKIYNVAIRDGLIKLEMEMNDSINKSLKYIYYLEV